MSKHFSVLLAIAIGVAVTLIAVSKLSNGKSGFSALTTSQDSNLSCSDCNVVIISMTNLRYDHVSGNGYSRPTTPNIDALEKSGLTFDNAFSHASWTLPESVSIYTSLYPYQHEVMNRYDGSSLSPSTPTLIDAVRQRGYKTAAFTGGFDYNTAFGLTSRFDHYEECTQGTGASYPRQPGPRQGGPTQYGAMACSAPKAITWLKANAGKKFFLQVQGFDAHCPFSQSGGKTYDPAYSGTVDFTSCLWTLDRTDPVVKDGVPYYPVYTEKDTDNTILLGPADVNHLLAIYDEAITSADRQIGDIVATLKSLGVYDRTIIVVTSEHGDMFGKYGRFMRGGPLKGTFYNDVLHIPLVIEGPNLPTKRISGLVEQVDILPTLLNLLGRQPNFHVEGKSLLSMVTSNQTVNDYVYAGSNFAPQLGNVVFKKSKVESIQNLDWKLIKEKSKEGESPVNYELYNLKDDPQELRNLANSNQTELNILQNLLEDWSRRVGGSK